MRYALIFNVISLITFLAAVFFLVTKGLNYSIEFTGGTQIEVHYKDSADTDNIRQTLKKAGYKVEVQNFGSSQDVLLRMPIEKGQSTSDLGQQVIKQLQGQDKSAELRRVEFVGPQVGAQLAHVLHDAPRDVVLFDAVHVTRDAQVPRHLVGGIDEIGVGIRRVL